MSSTVMIAGQHVIDIYEMFLNADEKIPYRRDAIKRLAKLEREVK